MKELFGATIAMTTAGITSLDTSRVRTEEDKIVSCKGTVNVVMNLQ